MHIPFDVDKIAERSDHLAGSIRDFMLHHYQRLGAPWSKLSEAEQRSLVDDALTEAYDLVRAAIQTIVANTGPAIQATVDSVTVKDGIKATLTMSRHAEQRHELVDAQGKAVFVLVMDPSDFGKAGKVETDPDEPEIPLEGADDGTPKYDPETGEIPQADADGLRMAGDDDWPVIDRSDDRSAA
jgi:hypothetical protein